MRKSVIINIVYPPTTPAFSHPSFPEGGEWRYHRLVKLPPNLKKHHFSKPNENFLFRLKIDAVCRLISFPVSNLHQSKPDHDPDHFADTGNQCSINPVGSGKGEATYGKCKASFTSTELHRQEEQKIGQQGGKGGNQAAVGKADVCCQHIKYQPDLKATDNTSRVF